MPHTSCPEPIRPCTGSGTHPAPRSPHFGHHHQVTPIPSAPGAMVTVARAKGTRSAPARLPTLSVWSQLSTEQPQHYCLGLYDQTQSRRNLPAALWGLSRKPSCAGGAVAAGGALQWQPPPTFPRDSRTAPFSSCSPTLRVPRAWVLGSVVRPWGVPPPRGTCLVPPLSCCYQGKEKQPQKLSLDHPPASPALLAQSRL